MAKKDLVELSVVKDFLNSKAGEYACELVKICNSKKIVNDEFIACKIGLKITEVRAILNRLHYHGVAYYDKKHDSRSGWYSYTWKINNRRIAELILGQQAEEVQKLESKRDFEKDYSFFSCKKNCDNFQFEIAAEYGFRCPQCGDMMNSIDSKKRMNLVNCKIKNLREEIDVLEKFCKAV